MQQIFAWMSIQKFQWADIRDKWVGGGWKNTSTIIFAKLCLRSIYWYFCSKIIQHSHAVLGTCPSITPSNVYFFSYYKKAHYFQVMDFNLNVCFHHFGVLGVTQRIKVIQYPNKFFYKALNTVSCAVSVPPISLTDVVFHRFSSLVFFFKFWFPDCDTATLDPYQNKGNTYTDMFQQYPCMFSCNQAVQKSWVDPHLFIFSFQWATLKTNKQKNNN